MRKPRELAALSKMEEKFNAARKIRQEQAAEVVRTGKCISCKKNPAQEEFWCYGCMAKIKGYIRELVKS